MVLETVGELRDMADDFSEEIQRHGGCGHGHHQPGHADRDIAVLAALGLVVTAVVIFTLVQVARK